MKKVFIYFLLLLGLGIFQSCEDVIDVDLPVTDQRLVVDALIRVPAVPNIFVTSIRLTTSASFYDQDVPVVTGAQVNLETSNEQYVLEDSGDGFYSANIPREVLETESIRLNIIYKNENYTAEARMLSTVPIDSLRQGDGSLFSGDESELIVAYTDPAPSEDFYLFDLDLGFYLVSEDTFYQGNAFSFSYFYEDLEPGRQINVDILGVDKPFYDYMNIVIAQTGQSTGGPFEAPPAVVKGNILNTTSAANYALGYFAIAQQYSDSIILE